VSESKARDAVLEAGERLVESRRNFFKAVGAGAAAASGLGAMALSPEAMAYGGPYAAAFVLDPAVTFMNIGTTGSTPTSVLKNLAANNYLIARDPTQSFNTQQMRDAIAPGFGAHPFEIVMSFNTTDGMSKIFNGIVLQPGDEIISTNMEHPGGNSPMQIKADRNGLVIKRANIPTCDAYSDAEMVARLSALYTPRTKAIMFSSPPYLTGIRMPEKALCQWAAQNGVISIIDGAHGPGMLALNFHDMGCDFYAGAGHKWQCGPGQTGILYVRNQSGDAPGQGGPYTNTTPLPTFFPTVSGGYTGVPGSTLAGGVRDPLDNVAAQLMSIGNPSYPALRALQECCQLWDTFGRQAIEDYIVGLAQYLRSRLVAIWGPRCLATTYDPATPHYARVALTSFNPFSPGYDYNADLSVSEAAAQTTASGNAVTALRTQHGVVVRNTNVPHSLRSNPAAAAVTAGTGATSSHPLRISTHLFHNMGDVDNLVAKLLLAVPHP
jgi:selenocysteine lyase/cysteine desulfurase